MTRTLLLLLALTLVSCSRRPPPPRPAADAVVAHPGRDEPVAPALATPPPDALSLDAVRARSGCVFESRKALCDGFRENFRSTGTGWVSDGCAWSAPRTSSGPFAEVVLVGIRVGYNQPASDASVERPLLDGAVREPASSEPGSTQLLLATRVGRAWFPIKMFSPRQGTARADAVDWALDDSGVYLTWSDHTGSLQHDEPDGYGESQREIAVVDRGVPMLAAQATIERWRSEVDLACSRTCHGAPNPPPDQGCSRRCASRVQETRSWERTGATLRVGATVVERRGPAADRLEVHPEPALTRRLDVDDHWLPFCAFMPVVRAVPQLALPSDDASVAARAGALAVLRTGSFRALDGVAAAVAPDAPRSTLQIDSTGGGGCGGGGCTRTVRYRTLAGTLPEQGVDYFEYERGTRVGCDRATLPQGDGPTYVEVALASAGAAIGCGFSGFDGTTRRQWVVTRVFERGGGR